MRDLLPYLKLYKKHWFGLTLGMLLALLTVLASIGLLTLSGWFCLRRQWPDSVLPEKPLTTCYPAPLCAVLPWDALQVVGASVSLLTTPPSSCSLICECFS